MNEKVESGLEVVGYVDPSDLARQISMYHVQREKGLCVYEPLTLLSDAERAVQLKHEAHRKTWRQLEQVTGLLREIIGALRSDRDLGLWQCRMNEADRWEREAAALSQQAEPVRCEYCDGTGDVHRADGEWIGECKECDAAEPAPAQDEREAFEECWAVRGTDDEGNLGRKPLRSLVDQQRYRGDAVNGSWVWFQRGAAWQRNRPAQTEQQPFWYAVVSEQAPSINSAIRRLDAAQEFADSKRERWPDTRVVPLYAAPIAQTAPQPEKSGRYTCIGKGGEYELIGRATTAGSLKMTGRFADEVIVYRDVISGDLYCRTPGNFRLRMGRTTPSPAMDAKEE
jgi:hypothetical protein